MIVTSKFKTLTLATACLFYGCGGGKHSSSSGGSSSGTTTTDNGGSDTSTGVAKSATLLSIQGALQLTAGASLVDSTPTAINCVDAIDGTVYGSGVALGEDGSFTCPNVPQCYDATSCDNANPVQVNIENAADNSLICVAASGTSGLVCDVAGCFAAAQAALPDDAKACLKSVNMVAASNVFQSALNKAYKMGEIPLDSYTLSSCLAMTPADRLKTLDTLTKGSLSQVLIGAIDGQLQKEINKCDSSKGKKTSLTDVMRDFLTIGFAISMGGDEYNTDVATEGTIAAALKTMMDQILLVKKAVANNTDPQTLVAAGTVNADILTYQFAAYCAYSGNGDAKSIERELNNDKTDWADCAASVQEEHDGGQMVTLNFVGPAIGTKLKFPNINDPQGLHNDDHGGSGIPFEYSSLKKVMGNLDKQFSLNDIFDVFFVNANGLKFRITAQAEKVGSDGSYSQTDYAIAADGSLTEVASESDAAADAYVPSMSMLFDFLTNKSHPFDLQQLISTKTHQNWNPTGQQYFYVNGKKVSGKEMPVTCDLVDANGASVGLNVTSGVSASCVVTDVDADQKRYYVTMMNGGDVYLALTSRANGNQIRGADNSPILLQNLNVSPGTGMPTCTTANEFNTYKYVSQNSNDTWMDNQTLKTICVDFSALKNAAEYYMPYQSQITIGTNTWPSNVLNGAKTDGSNAPVCINSSSAVSVADQFGCLTSAGVFNLCSDPTNQATCNCNWQNGEQMRKYSTLSSMPADGSIALGDCSDSSVYYLQTNWDPGSHASLASLSASLIASSNGNSLMKYNSTYDPTVVGKYVDAAFTECKASKNCWNKDDIKNYASAADIPSFNSWMKTNLVNFYCGNHYDDATIKADCANLMDSIPVSLPMTKFSNISDTAASNVYAIYTQSAYFSNIQIANPNYNRVFDFNTFSFKYANYDPFCDDIDGNGKCDFAAGGTANDVFFSDIWGVLNPAYRLLSPVDGLTGYTFDSANSLFPADPAGNWDQNTYNSQVNDVMKKLQGQSAIACSNDRTIKLTWQDMGFGPNNTWRTARPDTCKSANGYFVTRNIVPNMNTYFIDQPDQIMAMMRIAFGTVDKRSVSADEKRFDFSQAMSLFMLSNSIPPVVVKDDGTYAPYIPTITGFDPSQIRIKTNPTAYTGSLEGVIDLFLAK